mmetsp:Transcript_110579/g.312688  ORF Transcript_110579/g.312688 Transcript_110579/m.312688 type:complete len:398 (+) Transcript_110579:404-1597(+)
MGVVPVLQPADEAIGVCPLGRRKDLLQWSAGRGAVRYVLAERPVEEHRLLLHEADLRAQPAQVQAPEVRSVQQDPAGRGVVVAQQQPAHRGLAGAALADERDDVARVRREADVGEHRVVGPARVGEGHGLQGQAPGAALKPAAALERDLGHAEQQLHELARGGDGLLEVDPDVREALEAVLVEHDVLGKGRVGADGERTLDDLPQRKGQDDEVPQPREPELREPEDGLQVHGGLDHPQEVVEALHEPAGLLPLAHVCLDRPDAAQDLNGHSVGLGHGVILDHSVLSDCSTSAPHEHGADGRKDRCDECQLRMRAVHCHKRAHKLHARPQQGLSCKLGQRGQSRRVVDEPAGKLTAHVRIIKSNVLICEVLEELDPQPCDCCVATYCKKDADAYLAQV